MPKYPISVNNSQHANNINSQKGYEKLNKNFLRAVLCGFVYIVYNFLYITVG
jgi:hypothetical protein